MGEITSEEIEYLISLSLAEWAKDYDIPGIARELIKQFGRVPIDTIDSDKYWAIVAQYDHLVKE
jgi:hypothetical protein